MTPRSITDNPAEWRYVGKDSVMALDPHGVWQHRNNIEVFSNDEGKHYYVLSEVKPNGVRPMHTSQHYEKDS